MEDSQIIELFFSRIEKAITELAAKYGRVCHSISKNILGNEHDAEECVNDTYLGVWNTVPPQRPDPLLTYVCKITRNISITRYHSNTAKKRNSIYDVAINELEDCFPAAETPESEYETKELTKMIEIYLETLNSKDQAMFIRRYWFSDSVGDIAKQFNITENNASVRLLRMRKKLKKFLTERGVFI